MLRLRTLLCVLALAAMPLVTGCSVERLVGPSADRATGPARVQRMGARPIDGGGDGGGQPGDTAVDSAPHGGGAVHEPVGRPKDGGM